MTVGQLKTILNQYSDDMKIKMTYQCDNAHRDITRVRHCGQVFPFLTIETDEIPNYEDLSVMAESALARYDSVMLDNEREALNNLVGDE